MGTASPVYNPYVKGKMVLKTVGMVEQWKEQLGVERFCELCISNGCGSTCGGTLFGAPFYQVCVLGLRIIMWHCSVSQAGTFL